MDSVPSNLPMLPHSSPARTRKTVRSQGCRRPRRKELNFLLRGPRTEAVSRAFRGAASIAGVQKSYAHPFQSIINGAFDGFCSTYRCWRYAVLTITYRCLSSLTFQLPLAKKCPTVVDQEFYYKVQHFSAHTENCRPPQAMAGARS